MQRSGIDWNKIRLAYVHSTKSFTAIAAEFGVTAAAAAKRCEREGWVRLRREAADALAMQAEQEIERRRLVELTKWNEDDLRMASALRARVARQLAAAKDATDIGPAQLRQLAGVVESAQRVGRLALGATTENSGAAPASAGAVDPVTVEAVNEAVTRALGSI
jgi:hypothetical protein